MHWPIGVLAGIVMHWPDAGRVAATNFVIFSHRAKDSIKAESESDMGKPAVHWLQYI